MILYSIFKLKIDKYSAPFFLKDKDIVLARKKFSEFQGIIERSKFTEIFPESLKPLIDRAINPNPSLRPELTEFMRDAWFNDNLVTGLYKLADFYKLEVPKQKIYLKAFSKIVNNYSPKIIIERIVPFLKK